MGHGERTSPNACGTFHEAETRLKHIMLKVRIFDHCGVADKYFPDDFGLFPCENPTSFFP